VTLNGRIALARLRSFTGSPKLEPHKIDFPKEFRQLWVSNVSWVDKSLVPLLSSVAGREWPDAFELLIAGIDASSGTSPFSGGPATE
jgi:hypothetical protein